MLVTGEIYHILNKGTENRIIFQNKRDYERFLLTIFECNDINLSSENRHRRCKNKDFNKNKTQPLAEILCFCLMPNHFHIVARQLVDNGISKFMQRLGNSYTKYFNIKNNRKGSLFMARYKNVHVNNDSQVKHLIAYVHANPLDLSMPEWRLGKIRDFEKARDFLENYNWSSYVFYSRGEASDLVSQILNKGALNDFYSEKEDYFYTIKSWSGRYFEDI
ncbi:MAG: transposase [Patescibacteria group bacterium]